MLPCFTNFLKFFEVWKTTFQHVKILPISFLTCHLYLSDWLIDMKSSHMIAHALLTCWRVINIINCSKVMVSEDTNNLFTSILFHYTRLGAMETWLVTKFTEKKNLVQSLCMLQVLNNSRCISMQIRLWQYCRTLENGIRAGRDLVLPK